MKIAYLSRDMRFWLVIVNVSIVELISVTVKHSVVTVKADNLRNVTEQFVKPGLGKTFDIDR